MPRRHTYEVSVAWTGNRGSGTSGYRDYGRDHQVTAEGRPPIEASSEPQFRGDPARWNPELELIAALSQCHMLWYLHLCAVSGVVVTSYADDAHGAMEETEDGGGQFTEVVLRPRVTVSSPGMVDAAVRLHKEAHAKCFIARSVSFPVRHEPVVADREVADEVVLAPAPLSRVVVMDQKLPEPLATHRVEIRRITIAPRYAAGLHIHNGPVFGSIETGSAVYQIEGEPETVLKPGDVFYEPEGVRIARFDAQEDGVTFVGYFLLADGVNADLAFPGI